MMVAKVEPGLVLHARTRPKPDCRMCALRKPDLAGPENPVADNIIVLHVASPTFVEGYSPKARKVCEFAHKNRPFPPLKAI